MALLQLIFEKYWAQSTFLVLGFSYFVKRVFDNKSKKMEVSNSIFQQNRISAVAQYIDAYSKVKEMWTMFPHGRAIGGGMSANEIDAKVFPPLHDLDKASRYMTMYFAEKDYKKFSKIDELMSGVNRALLNAITNAQRSREADNFPMISKFLEVKSHAINESDTLILAVGQVLRKHYGEPN